MADPSTFTAVDLSRLPAPTIVETLDFDTIYGQMLAALQALVPTFDATVESDPVIKLLQVAAYREMLLRARVNDAARAVMPAYTAANALAKLVTVDGAGSGLDADLLDGRNGAEYALLTGSTFTGAVTGAAGLYRDANFYLNLVNATTADLSFDAGDVIRFDRVNNVYRHFIGSNEIFQVAGSYVNANAALLQQGNQVWHVGNDGSGSGLDADLLDGRHASEFSRVTAFSSAANGYRVHADGYKECWGSTFVGANSSTVIGLPVAHSAWCVPTGSCSIAQDEASIGVVQVSGNPPDSFIVRNRNPVGTTFFWHTRGV